MNIGAACSRRGFIGLHALLTAGFALEHCGRRASAQEKSTVKGTICLALSSDGTALAAPIRDKGVALFNYQTGERLRMLEVSPGVRVESLALSGNGEKPKPGGMVLAAGCSDGTVSIWDAQSGAKQGIIKAHAGSVTSLLFSTDGKTLFTASSNETHIKFWDVLARAPVNDIVAHPVGVRSMALSDDGKLLASGGAGFSPAIHLWNVSDPAATRRFSSYLRGGHELSILSLAFSPGGKQLLSGSWDKTVQIWDLADRKSLHVLTGHTAEVLAVAWHPDGVQVVSAGLDKTVRIWDSKSGKELRSLGKNTAALYALVIAQDGKSIVTGGENGVSKLKLSAE